MSIVKAACCKKDPENEKMLFWFFSMWQPQNSFFSRTSYFKPMTSQYNILASNNNNNNNYVLCWK